MRSVIGLCSHGNHTTRVIKKKCLAPGDWCFPKWLPCVINSMLVYCLVDQVNFMMIHVNFIVTAYEFLHSWSIILHQFYIFLSRYPCGWMNWSLQLRACMQHAMKVICILHRENFPLIWFFVMCERLIINGRALSAARALTSDFYGGMGSSTRRVMNISFPFVIYWWRFTVCSAHYYLAIVYW